MKAYLLLGLAFATPALAQAPAASAAGERSPAEATTPALAACVDHARGAVKIEGKSRELDQAGLKYQLNAPDFLASTKSTRLGIAEYAKSPSTQGEIWAIGYASVDASGDSNSGACRLVALGVPVPDVEKSITDYFSKGRTWHLERGGDKPPPGVRTMTYTWSPRRNLKLTALVELRDADNQASVTITQAFQN